MEKNFLGIKNVKMSEAKFVIMPVPFEFSTSFIKGTAFAPESIISVSEQLEFFDEKYHIEPYKYGIRTLSPLQINIEKPSSMIKIIEKEAKKIIGKGKFLISIGGEHTITYGLVKAFGHFHKNFNVLILDAHSDLRDSYQGSKFSHACVSRRIVEDGFKVYITGVRSISKGEFMFAKSKNNVEIFYAYQMKKMDWRNEIAKNLPSGKYYLSFDADFLDPSVLPEVGTPEPGTDIILSGANAVPLIKEVENSKGIGIITNFASDIFTFFIPRKFFPIYGTKTAAATTVVQRPFFSPIADWAILVVLTILPDIFHTSFFSS